MHRAGGTPTPTTRAARTLTPTATGTTFPATATCGSPRSRPAGHLIPTVRGFGSQIGVTPGCRRSRGVGHLTTTVAGSYITMPGLGGRGRSSDSAAGTDRSGRRHTLTFSASAASGSDSDSASDSDSVPSAGFLSDPAIRSSLGGDDGVGVEDGEAGTAAGSTASTLGTSST